MKWVKASERLPEIEVVEFDKLIKHGRENSANIVNGMPWSFSYKGHPVTHEKDNEYLVGFLLTKCTKDNPVVFFNGKVFNYWRKLARLSILYKGMPEVLIYAEGCWCFWPGKNRATGTESGAFIRLKPEDLLHIEWLDESAESSLQDQVRKLRDGLGDCDTLLSHLEDHTHGDDGKMITEQRGNIQQLLTETEG